MDLDLTSDALYPNSFVADDETSSQDDALDAGIDSFQDGMLSAELAAAITAASVATGASADPSVWGYDTSPTARHMDLGVNMGYLSAAGQRDHVFFINQMKSAAGWSSYSKDHAITFDDNGYVSSMREGAVANSEVLRRSLDVADVDAHFGDFRLYGTGEGEIRVSQAGFGNKVDRTHTSTLATEIIDGVEYWYVDLTYDALINDKGHLPKLMMHIHGVTEGNHIQDLALVHHNHLDNFAAGEIFNPQLIEDVSHNGTLRFMDWMGTNILYHDKDFNALDPEKRYISEDHYTYLTRAGGHNNLSFQISSMPIETIVAFTNAVGADAWINLPADVTDARVAKLAEFVQENLDPELTVYWEYGNELWNSAHGFDSHQYAVKMAQETFGLEGRGTAVAAEWAAYRGPQVYEIIQAIFDGDDNEARFIAPAWAFADVVNKNGSLDKTSFSYQYFQAAEAQKMADAPVRPEDIVTDYAIGMYFGSVSGKNDVIAEWIMENYEDVDKQAEVMARWMLFGANEDTYYDLDKTALEDPATDVVYQEGINIAVSKLIFQDVKQTGLDPLNDLGEVLRFDGLDLQYRGVMAEEWTTILTFAEDPGRSLEEMVLDVELIGLGHLRYGQVITGAGSSVQTAADLRLGGHSAFVEGLGLNFVAYEGGTSLAAPPPGAEAMYKTYVQNGWDAVVTNAYFDKAEDYGVDLFVKYKSHDIFTGQDHWGTRAHVGQDVSEAHLAKMFIDSIELGTPDAPLEFDQLIKPGFDPITFHDASTGPIGIQNDDIIPVSEEVEDEDPAPDTAPDTLHQLQFKPSDNWVIDPDTGSATETDARNGKLTLTSHIEPATPYKLSFNLSSDAEDPGNLRVYIQAFGQGVTEILTWKDVAADGQISLDLGEIPEPHDKLRVMISRAEGREGVLDISDITLEALPQDDSDDTTKGWSVASSALQSFSDTLWEAGEDWRYEADDAAAVVSEKTHDRLKTVAAVAPGAKYMIAFDVASEVENPGEMRLNVQAFGKGLSLVGEYREHVSDGQRVEVMLDEIPEPHDKLRISINRGSGQEGEIAISNFDLVMVEAPLFATTPFGWS